VQEPKTPARHPPQAVAGPKPGMNVHSTVEHQGNANPSHNETPLHSHEDG